MNIRNPKMDIELHAAHFIACSNRGDKNRILRYKLPNFQHLE